MCSLIRKLLLTCYVFCFVSGCSVQVDLSNRTNQTAEDIAKTSLQLDIVTIGDSLTKGVGSEEDKIGYQETFIDMLRLSMDDESIHLSSFGKKGLTSNQLKKYIQQEDVKQSISNGDIIVLTVGGNDIMSIVKKHYMHLKLPYFTEGLKKYEDNIRYVINDIKNINQTTPIYLVGIYNPFNEILSDIKEFQYITDLWNNQSNQIAMSYEKVYFIDISSDFKEMGNFINENDNFHPNSNGYQVIGEAVYQSFIHTWIE